MKKLFVVLSALTLSTAVSACSDHHEENMGQRDMNSNQGEIEHREHMNKMTEYYFNKMDTNHDGYVSKKEYDVYMRKMFKQADTNHDGMLTLEEIKAQKMREKEEMKSYMESNQNR